MYICFISSKCILIWWLDCFRNLNPRHHCKQAAKPRADDTVALKRVKKYVKDKGARWWNTLEIDDLGVLDLKPLATAILVDRANGRLRVHHRGLKGSNKSFSWTKKGFHKAAAECLIQAWFWEQTVSGTLCPLPEELVDLALS